MYHAHKKLPLGVMRLVEALHPDSKLVSCEPRAFNGRDERANVHAAWGRGVSKCVAYASIEKCYELSIVNRSNCWMSCGVIVSDVSTLIEKEKSIFSDEIQLKAKIQKSTVLKLEKVLFFKVGLQDLRNDR